jgi:phosphohistidine phosphatase
MQIYLVQHGEAKPEEEDPERALTSRGIDTVRAMAEWATARGAAAPHRIHHSGKRRAEQTATLLAERLEPRGGVAAVSGLNPKDDVEPLARALEVAQEPLMLVGHQPFLGRLAARLLAGDAEREIVAFRYAAILCLAREDGRWRLHWMMAPELLAER